MKFKKLIISFFAINLIAFGLGLALFNNSQAFSGWLWSGNKEDATGNDVGFGLGEVSNSYGFNIPTEEDGNVTGYVWSENIGWIDFDPVGPYPDSPSHSVKRDGNRLIGWARIVGIANEQKVGNSGGWEGWIKMTGITQLGASYGINLESVNNGENNTLGDYAYSDELGWITFEGLELPNNPGLKICPNNNLKIDINPKAGEEAQKSVDLGAYYKTKFFSISCSMITEPWVTPVDSSSTWTSANSGFTVNSEGVVSTTPVLNKDDTTIITATYNGSSNQVEVCAYDCSPCFAKVGEEKECDCGCGVSMEVKKGSYWVED